MLIQLGINESLAKSHSLAQPIPGSSLVWNPESSKYELTYSEDESKFQTRFWAALIALGSSFYGLNAVMAANSGNLGMSVLCGLFGIGMATAAVTLLLSRRNSSDCASFLNGLIGIGEAWKEDEVFRELVRPSLIVKLLTQTLILTQMVYPWVLSVVALPWPCSPLNMFSSVNPYCSPDGSGSPDPKAPLVVVVAASVGTAAAQAIFWKGVMSQMIMNSMHVFLGSLCQKVTLQFLEKLLLHQRQQQQPLLLHMGLYRSCQLLNTSFSNYCSSVGLALISALVAGEISSTFLVLKILSGDSSNLPLVIQLFLFVLCPTFFFFHVMAVGGAAAVHTLSEGVLASSKTANTAIHNNNRITRRVLQSAWPVRVKFGECNYIEGSTTLIMLDFTIRRLVDLLLIGQKKG